MKITLPLEQITKKNLPQVGSKAFKLAELKKTGFIVPPAFILTTQGYQEFLKDNNLTSLVAQLTLGRDRKFLEQTCQELQVRILKGKINSVIRKAIQKGLDSLTMNKIAVRSSATCEDGQIASFSGQFESFLPLYANQVLESIRKCWASVFNQGILSYILFHEIPFYKIKMACLIQKVIKAEKGGLTFTKNLLNGQNDTLVIEALAGSPEQIVSATKNPNRWVISKKDGKVINKVLTNTYGILTKEELKRVFRTSLEIEKLYQKPQDIEWIINNKQLFILQTRPITG